MNQYYKEDSIPGRQSSQSRKTCPARSDGADDAKKMRLARSTGDLNTQAYYTRNMERSHGRVAHFKEKEPSNRFEGYINADGKPNYGQSGSSSQAVNERGDTMEVEGTPPNEDHGTEEQMDAEDVNNIQTHSSTPRKEFPAPARFTIPSTERAENESISSGDNTSFQRLSPPLNVQGLHIRDPRYPTRSLPEFTNQTPAAAQIPHPIHQNPIHQNPHYATQPSIGTPKSDLLQLDMKDGRNRLSTFEAYWPVDSEFFNSKVLVSYGFYATGAGDAVRCFECNATIANWEKDDDPKRRHLEISPDCRFANGHSCGNRPLSPVRNSKRYPGGSSRGRTHPRGRTRPQRNSYDNKKRPMYPSRRTNLAAPAPHVSRQRSTSPLRSSSNHSASTRISRSSSLPPGHEPPEPAREPVAFHEYMNPSPSLIERTNRMEAFPCQNPINPEMREVSARRRTFDDPQFRANTRLRASNATLADAGMYYTGQSDDTNCWYCGGGLRRYQPNDDPWVEHAKFFPSCEYLLQQRGPGWIHGISVQFPNTVRPASQRMHNLAVPLVRQPSPAPANPVPVAPPPPPPQNTPALPPIHQGQFQATPLVIPQRTQPTRPQGQTTRGLPHIPESRQFPQQPHPMSPPPAPQNPPRNPIQHPVPNVPQQPPPPPPPPAQSGPRNLRTAGGSAIEDPQAMIQEREQMVDASMHTEGVQEARSMGFTEDQIRSAQMRRVIGLGGPYQTSNLLIEALLNPNTDPAVLEPPQQPPPPPRPQAMRGRNVDIRNGRIQITGGNFNRAIIGGGRGRSQIIIDGVPLHEYIAQRRGEVFEGGAAQPVVFNNVGTAVATQPYHTAPTPSTAPMNAETSTTNSNDVPSTSTTNRPAPTGTAEERLEALQKEYQCKICYSAPVEVLFEPCGHICACLSCGSRVSHCPMCRKRITRYIKTYHC